jgi:hypothetical protein
MTTTTKNTRTRRCPQCRVVYLEPDFRICLTCNSPLQPHKTLDEILKAPAPKKPAKKK